MSSSFKPMLKRGMADRLAARLTALIREGQYQQGDRLPAITEMAKSFGVGHPTIREALRRLEAVGVVEIRHGSGVYVARSDEVLVVASPDYSGDITRKLLLDLIRTRTPLEVQSVADAVEHATEAHVAEMRRLLTVAGENLENDVILNKVNMSFHRQIAISSGNSVLAQLVAVMGDLFREEQRIILGIHGPRSRDHKEHLGILEAIERRNSSLGVDRMRAHLRGVEEAILGWDPEKQPVR